MGIAVHFYSKIAWVPFILIFHVFAIIVSWWCDANRLYNKSETADIGASLPASTRQRKDQSIAN